MYCIKMCGFVLFRFMYYKIARPVEGRPAKGGWQVDYNPYV